MPRANSETGLKVCSKCQTEQPFQNFHRDARRADGLQPQCKECNHTTNAAWHARNLEAARQRDREWKAKNPEKVLASNRRWMYGISPEDVIALRKAQGGKCPGCQRDLSTVRECVDHDHETNETRGLLCRHCNLVLGHAKDDPEILLRLAAYLRAAKSANLQQSK